MCVHFYIIFIIKCSCFNNSITSTVIFSQLQIQDMELLLEGQLVFLSSSSTSRSLEKSRTWMTFLRIGSLAIPLSSSTLTCCPIPSATTFVRTPFAVLFFSLLASTYICRLNNILLYHHQKNRSLTLGAIYVESKGRKSP